jgi:hypothetical protein
MEDAIDPSGTRPRALHQWDENGFDELYGGLVFCVLCGSLPLGEWILGRNFPMMVPFVMLACLSAIGFITRKARAKLVYPRTGYVVFRPRVPRKWIYLSSLVLGLVPIIAQHLWRPTMPDLSRAWGLGCGLFFAASFAWDAIQYKMPRYLWIAGLSLVLGGATFVAGAKQVGIMWVLAGVGLAMALDGALRMKRFWRTHPRIEEQHG